MKPLTHGSVLIAGCKSSNFNEEFKKHPRIILWDSQQGSRWNGKSIPDNVQAVFTTKWIGHAEFANLLKEVRKKNITIFPVQGTGEIVRMTKELLMMETEVNNKVHGKLAPLTEMIDPEKTNIENARVMMVKAQELGIKTTETSLKEFVRRKKHKSVDDDVVVQMFDNAIKELRDARDYFIAVNAENAKLKARIEKFKKLLDGVE